MVDMVLKALPKIAAQVAAPLNSVNKITMVSNGDGEIGVSKLTGTVCVRVLSCDKHMS